MTDFILYRNVNDFIFNLMCVYVHDTCEGKFAGCKKSFSWLGQKVNKIIDAYGHDADDSGMDLCPCHGHGMMPCPVKTSRHHSVFKSNLKPLNIRIQIKFEATEYSYSILDS